MRRSLRTHAVPAMIRKECKRLAKVDFPIAVVSKHAPREESNPPGHRRRDNDLGVGTQVRIET